MNQDDREISPEFRSLTESQVHIKSLLGGDGDASDPFSDRISIVQEPPESSPSTPAEPEQTVGGNGE